MKKVTAVLMLLLVSSCSAFAETVEVESKVTSAIVYINSCQVTRLAQVTLKPGTQEVILNNVPENLNESTLTVAATGTALAKILDAKVKTIFLERAESETIRNLEDEIQKVEDQITDLNNQQQVIAQERELLKSIKLHGQSQIPEDLITKMPPTQELDSLNTFLKNKWQESYLRELEITKQVREINLKLAKLRKELNQLRNGQEKQKRVISVELEVDKPGVLNVSASYLMYQASWYPEYDARVNYQKQKVELSCLGVVKQTSGEDWQNVELTLSTAKPTVSGKMPQMESWVLMPYYPPLSRTSHDKGGMAFLGVMQKESRLQESDSQDILTGAFAGKKQETTVPLEYAQTQEKLTSVNYKITHPVSIKADGTKHRLPVRAEEFTVQFNYSATPKLSEYAYLMAKVKNEKEQLLPAAVRVFLDGTYVGSSSLEAVGKGEEFDLYLGIDEGVKVKREKIKEEVKEVWIAGIKRNNKVVLYTYKITLENYKDKAIKIDLFDQTPVSGHDQIAIKVLEINPAPAQENYEDKKGVWRWEFNLNPAQKQEIIFTYQLEYPRDIQINLY